MKKKIKKVEEKLDTPKKISYKEFSKQLKIITNLMTTETTHQKFAEKNPKLNYDICSLRRNVLLNYDSYTSDEQRQIFEKFSLLDSLISDFMLVMN